MSCKQWIRLKAMTALAVVSCQVPAQAETWLQLERIDLQPNGSPSATRNAVGSPSISDDGRWVVFTSGASDLVADDTNARSDIFVRDRRNHTTRRLSLRPNGTQSTGTSGNVAMSSNARFVVFVSSDSELVPNDTNFKNDQFLLDRDADGNGVFDEPGGTSIVRVSVGNGGVQLAEGAESFTGAVSADGRSVMFATSAAIAANDTNNLRDVYVLDRPSATVRLLSQSAGGQVGDGASPAFFSAPMRISDSGAVAAFTSDATNLVLGDGNDRGDVFVRHRDSDGNGIFDEPAGTTISRASVGPGGMEFPDGSPTSFDLSRDGRWLAFMAYDTTGANPHGSDIFVRDLVGSATTVVPFLASLWAKGSSNDCCGNNNPLIARNADMVAFTSQQSFAFSGGNSIRSDVFLQPRARPLIRLTDFPVPTSPSDGYRYGVGALSANGVYMVITVNAGTSPVIPQEGTYVYQRDTVFVAGFD